MKSFSVEFSVQSMSHPQLNEESLPLLFQVSDAASIKAQTNYYRRLKIHLSLLIISAAPAFTLSDENNRIGAVVSLVSFVAALSLLLWQNNNKQMETWYSSRAVAESTKTMSWRWIMQSISKAGETLTETEKQERLQLLKQDFVSDLSQVIEQNKAFSSFSASDLSIQNSVTDTMSYIKSLPRQERLGIYKKQRIEDQAQWYRKKAKFNESRSALWRWISILLHVTAIVLLILRIFVVDPHFPIEVISTTAGAVISWMEAKRYSELKSSYGLTADEIDGIKKKLEKLEDDEKSLSDFVADSEAAFSREHTQWVARASA